MVKMPPNTKGMTPVTTGSDRVGDQNHGSDDGSEDGLEMKGPRPILDDDEVDELTMVVGKSGALRPIARRLGSESDEVAPARALAPDERPTTGSRPPVNGDTPNAYKILGQVGRLMVATSAWIIMFGPKEVGGAKWVTIEKELASPIDSSEIDATRRANQAPARSNGFRVRRHAVEGRSANLGARRCKR
ncbi:unnamed protein product [Phytophthora fragariaefolia]|uniref:Unnamed protein product n=1 Tax=Phytophthora fragariaefolia TaxID=1490495 RepID=A0A9W6UC81_9STRA|nr:unnamed protein product [Phytophthora fragariaefolia]